MHAVWLLRGKRINSIICRATTSVLPSMVNSIEHTPTAAVCTTHTTQLTGSGTDIAVIPTHRTAGTGTRPLTGIVVQRGRRRGTFEFTTRGLGGRLLGSPGSLDGFWFGFFHHWRLGLHHWRGFSNQLSAMSARTLKTTPPQALSYDMVVVGMILARSLDQQWCQGRDQRFSTLPQYLLIRNLHRGLCS